MKIAYCTHTDPMDKRSWSGTHYYMKKALERRGVKIRAFGPLKNRYLSIYRRYRKLLERLFNKRISEYHMKAVCSSFAKALGHMLKEAREQFDYLFFPAGSHILSRLKTDIPCVLISDASFPGMINYYPEFTNLTKSAIKQGMETERTAIEKSGMVFYASDWALESAAKAYGDHIRKKCFVIPFGANMEIRHDRSILERRKPHQGEIRILFVASSQSRKGGVIVHNTVKLLNQQGMRAKMIACGQKPPEDFLKSEYLDYRGYLNKNDERQKKELYDLYIASDFFMMPTRYECAGIVFCEASAFGLPIITSSTGGVETYARKGENALVASLDDNEWTYVEMIADLWNDAERYANMAKAAFNLYEERLNWDVWAHNVLKSLDMLTP